MVYSQTKTTLILILFDIYVASYEHSLEDTIETGVMHAAIVAATRAGKFT